MDNLYQKIEELIASEISECQQKIRELKELRNSIDLIRINNLPQFARDDSEDFS